MQIQVDKTLDVEFVEQQLAELWQQAADGTADDAAVMRARVANLLVFVSSESRVAEVAAMLRELTSVHPCRVLMMRGAREAEDRDIELSVESFFQSDKRAGARRLCCEEVLLRAQGQFVAELPSAALPLLVPDLSTFVWWRDALQVSDKVFHSLLRASDRLVIDSAEFANPQQELAETNKLFNEAIASRVGISDLNWARLTSWRGLLADFYDVPACQVWLERVDLVRIEYVGPELTPETVAPQALLIAGWLASRLGWQLSDEKPSQDNDATISFKFRSSDQITSNDAAEHRGSSPTSGSPDGQPGWGETVRESVAGRAITLEFSRIDQGERKPGRLVQVELRVSGQEPTSFIVSRSADNVHLLTEARQGTTTHRGRVLPVRNRSAAHLLSREMEILCNDQIYQEAVAVAATMIVGSTSLSRWEK